MKTFLKFSLLFVFIFVASRSFGYVRSVYLGRPDEIIPIRTAIGIATIIQVPEAIQSAIIGDASAFKVEYLNKAVTLKPLRYGARTNLYLVTQARRYNLRLVTVSQNQADYVVYLKEGTREKPIRWRNVRLSHKTEYTALTVSRIGRTPLGFLLIDGKYWSAPSYSMSDTSGQSNTNSLQPKDFWVLQKKRPISFDTLYLSKLRGTRRCPIDWSIAINGSSINVREPLAIKIRGIHTVEITIQARYLWK